MNSPFQSSIIRQKNAHNQNIWSSTTCYFSIYLRLHYIPYQQSLKLNKWFLDFVFKWFCTSLCVYESTCLSLFKPEHTQSISFHSLLSSASLIYDGSGRGETISSIPVYGIDELTTPVIKRRNHEFVFSIKHNTTGKCSQSKYMVEHMV